MPRPLDVQHTTPLQAMLPTLFALSCLLSGTLGLVTETACYGNTYKFPIPTTSRGKVYFTPTSGEPKQLVFENGEVKGPRFTISHSLSLRDVKKSDEGTYRFFKIDDVQIDLLRLTVKDCAERIERHYLESFHRSPVDFEYVEYSPVRYEQTRVLWNRTNPNASRRKVHLINNIWQMRQLTQDDAGFYNFRHSDNSLVMRMQLFIKAYEETYTVEEGDDLHIWYPGVSLSDSFYTVTFERGIKLRLMRDGQWVIGEQDYFVTPDFTGRYLADHNSFTVESMTMTDNGIFEFYDASGNMILTVEVIVQYVPTPGSVYVIIAATLLFLLVVCCCCCVKKCCCKKGASKGSTAAPQVEAAPAVYYHGETQPSGPTYSAHSHSASPAVAPSYRPLNPVVGGGEAPSHDPPTYNLVFVHDNPTWPPPTPQDKTQLSAPTYPAHAYSASPAEAPSYQPVNPGGSSGEAPSNNLPFPATVPSFSTGSGCVSTDADLRFELKGMTFPSAPPLSSDSATSDVYTSDKFNFL